MLSYKNLGKEVVPSALGEMQCIKTESIAKSSIGQSILGTYYNQEMGFVKMEYQALEKYKIVFELKEISDWGEIASPTDYLLKKQRR